MRRRRIKYQEGRAVYHCITRVVGGQFLLDDSGCKEVLRKQMHQVARFCGVEILTYCIMSNHFHILVRVPPRDNLSLLDNEELLRRCRELYQNDEIAIVQWENRLNSEDQTYRNQCREQLLARMGDVSAYMKELKQRFSIWYNRTHNRFGTLWAERFKSVLIENTRAALMMVAAYIDLNPVRAGLVADPKDYRYCGYAEMLAKGGMMRDGLGQTFQGYSPSRALEEYRKLLFGAGVFGKDSGGAAIDPSVTRSELDRGGKLTAGELIRHRVRYFTDGAILGSRNFLEERISDGKCVFSKKKSNQFRSIPIEENEDLLVFRNLRKQAIS
jgi:putative transposase